MEWQPSLRYWTFSEYGLQPAIGSRGSAIKKYFLSSFLAVRNPDCGLKNGIILAIDLGGVRNITVAADAPSPP
jgi:hypothetical protein